MEQAPPPRFSPDNSDSVRAMRIAAHGDIAYDHALAWVQNRPILQETVEVNEEKEQDVLQPSPDPGHSHPAE